MTEQQENSNKTCENSEQLDLLKKEILAIIDEKFDVEAVAQMVEQLKTSGQIQNNIQSLHQQISNQSFALGSIQNELRNVMMDVALVKRALVSLGQVGVTERKRIEKELILELFPPKQASDGLGIVVAQHKNHDLVELDCEKRIPICKQACCRIFNIHLDADEAESGHFDWNPKMPYTMYKNQLGCIYLNQGKCSVYHNRPKTCYTYSCKKDFRIWSDYEKMELNPSLKQRLISANLLPKEELTRKQDIATESTENIKPPDFSFRVRRVYQSQRFSVIIATRRLLAGRERIKIFRKRQLRLL